RPFYDRKRRKLWLGGRLVKRFKQRAPLQHGILSSFQKLGWPPQIADPLPAMHDRQQANLRLGDVIKRLNRYQENRLIRFRGDGTGQGILWEPVETPEVSQRPQRD